MSSLRRNRLVRVAAALPPPPVARGPDALTPEELNAMSTPELLARFWARFETEEARAESARIERLSDAELIDAFNRGSVPWRRP